LGEGPPAINAHAIRGECVDRAEVPAFGRKGTHMNSMHLELAAFERHEELLRSAAQQHQITAALRAAREQEARRLRIERLRRQADASRDRLRALELRQARELAPWVRLGRALRLVARPFDTARA
jgi:hypothetical protein